MFSHCFTSRASVSVRLLLLLSIFLFVSIAENEKISLIVQLTELTSHFREGNEEQRAKSDFQEIIFVDGEKRLFLWMKLDGVLIIIQFCDGNLIRKPFGDVNFCEGWQLMWRRIHEIITELIRLSAQKHEKLQSQAFPACDDVRRKLLPITEQLAMLVIEVSQFPPRQCQIFCCAKWSKHFRV